MPHTSQNKIFFYIIKQLHPLILYGLFSRVSKYKKFILKCTYQNYPQQILHNWHKLQHRISKLSIYPFAVKKIPCCACERTITFFLSAKNIDSGARKFFYHQGKINTRWLDLSPYQGRKNAVSRQVNELAISLPMVKKDLCSTNI